MEIIGIIIGFVIVFCLGIVIGTMCERVRWNELIDDGDLPKPKRKWVYKDHT